LAKSSLVSFVDDVDNPWISSISTRIYPPSMDIYPDASRCIHGEIQSKYIKMVDIIYNTCLAKGNLKRTL
jgi:hypothetical protein